LATELRAAQPVGISHLIFNKKIENFRKPSVAMVLLESICSAGSALRD
jgi:hypothetical protein